MFPGKFSKWLDIQVIEVGERYSKLQLEVRDDMLNALGSTHGGIIFSLADSAMGYAANYNNQQHALALEASVTFTRRTGSGDIITAEATCTHNGKTTALYLVTVLNQQQQTIALFKGTVFKTNPAS